MELASQYFHIILRRFKVSLMKSNKAAFGRDCGDDGSVIFPVARKFLAAKMKRDCRYKRQGD
jgi:hypothetical protein